MIQPFDSYINLDCGKNHKDFELENILSTTHGLKIGISWKTGAGRGENLSIPLKFWREVLSLEAFFVNLQYE